MATGSMIWRPTMAKSKTPKMPKRRNIQSYNMIFRFKNGGAAGYHSQKGYSRKVKHKGRQHGC